MREGKYFNVAAARVWIHLGEEKVTARTSHPSLPHHLQALAAWCCREITVGQRRRPFEKVCPILMAAAVAQGYVGKSEGVLHHRCTPPWF